MSIERGQAQDADSVAITVRDNGAGIRPEFITHVFERFRQAESSEARSFGGLGLGLSIVRQLVDLHGGSIEGRSAGLGLGATFVVRLPRWRSTRPPENAPLPAVDATPQHEAVLDRFDQRVAPRLPALRAQVLHNDFAPGNVLIDESFRVTGVTDFGDMTHTSLVCDLAVACADVLSGHEDGAGLVADVVAGYDSVTPLESGELAVVADLVAARYAASVLITARRTREQGWAPALDEVAHRQLGILLDRGLDAVTDAVTAPIGR